MLKVEREGISGADIHRHRPGRRISRSRLGVARIKGAREKPCSRRALRADGLDIDQPDGDGFVGTGLHTGWGLTHGEPVVAHIALAHDAEGLRVLRHIVGALHRAGTGNRCTGHRDAVRYQFRHPCHRP